MDHNIYSEVTPDIVRLSSLAQNADVIDTELFTRYNVKRGLRDLNGKGVLAGLTNISDVRAKEIINGEEVPAHGQLFYRGYNVKDLVSGFTSDNRFGFEEITYLLLFSKLPNAEAVSYTHLDVYKRQERISSLFLPARAISAAPFWLIPTP